MRYIRTLTKDEISSLEYGYKYGKKHYFRLKCQSLLMSNEGKTIKEIASFAKKTSKTIRNWFTAFEQEGIEKLVIKSGRGIKAALDALSEEQIDLVKKELEKNYQNLKTASSNLSNALGFPITKNMLTRYIKKNFGTLGIESVKA